MGRYLLPTPIRRFFWRGLRWACPTLTVSGLTLVLHDPGSWRHRARLTALVREAMAVLDELDVGPLTRRHYPTVVFVPGKDKVDDDVGVLAVNTGVHRWTREAVALLLLERTATHEDVPNDPQSTIWWTSRHRTLKGRVEAAAKVTNGAIDVGGVLS